MIAEGKVPSLVHPFKGNVDLEALDQLLTEHGDPAKLLAEYGLDAQGIEQSIRRRFPKDNTIPLRA